MQFNTQFTSSPLQLKASALFVGVYESQKMSTLAAILDKSNKKLITSILKSEFSAKLGKTLVLRNLEGVQAQRVILVGLGKKEEFGAKQLLKAYEAMTTCANESQLSDIVDGVIQEPCAALATKLKAQLAARALSNANYSYTETFSQENAPAKKTLRKVTFLCVDKAEQAEIKTGASIGAAIAEGMKFTRELGNLPGNICTPTYLGEQALALAKQYKNVKVEVLKRKQIEQLKMGAFLSVAAGTDQEPRFIIIKYFGQSAKTTTDPKEPIVLVGKGVTFDSGGISLKPGANMDEMKFDMCGAGSVLGTMKAIMEMKLKLDVIALIPATENLPNGHATKPGDVVTSLSGQTIEVLNTDAEGRLILCDALTYAERFDPKVVIDVATLTGACVVALGHVHSGLYSNQDKLAKDLLFASQQSQDTAWHMPLDDDYQVQLKSNFADMQNIGGPAGGSVTAACFLSRFTRKYHWAHLDIAGTAWDSGARKGASGRPVPLLTQFLINKADC